MSECPACLRFDQDPRSYELGSLDSRATLSLELHHALISELNNIIQGNVSRRPSTSDLPQGRGGTANEFP